MSSTQLLSERTSKASSTANLEGSSRSWSSRIFHHSGDVFLHVGTQQRLPGPDPEGRYGAWGFVSGPRWK
jgi:hypothetical protein